MSKCTCVIRGFCFFFFFYADEIVLCSLDWINITIIVVLWLPHINFNPKIVNYPVFTQLSCFFCCYNIQLTFEFSNIPLSLSPIIAHTRLTNPITHPINSIKLKQPFNQLTHGRAIDNRNCPCIAQFSSYRVHRTWLAPGDAKSCGNTFCTQKVVHPAKQRIHYPMQMKVNTCTKTLNCWREIWEVRVISAFRNLCALQLGHACAVWVKPY